MKRKIYLCSFGNLNLSTAAYRYYHQALNMGIFEHIFMYNECSLDLAFVREFKDRFYEEIDLVQFGANRGGALSTESFSGGRNDPFFMSTRLVKPTRGFGFWCWKPQIILQSLLQINDGDILIYADLGCEFCLQGKENLMEALRKLDSSDMMGFFVRLSERAYTKGDIFRHFGVEDNPHFSDSNQICGGIIFMKKSAKTLCVINEWLDILKNHWHFVDDSPSRTPNLQGFIQNRHDQSIWSIINKKYGFENLPLETSEKCGILVSRKTRNAIGMFVDTQGNIKPFKKIKFKLLHAIFKLGTKTLPPSKARESCKIWLKYTRV